MSQEDRVSETQGVKQKRDQHLWKGCFFPSSVRDKNPVTEKIKPYRKEFLNRNQTLRSYRACIPRTTHYLDIINYYSNRIQKRKLKYFY